MVHSSADPRPPQEQTYPIAIPEYHVDFAPGGLDFLRCSGKVVQRLGESNPFQFLSWEQSPEDQGSRAAEQALLETADYTN